MTNYNGKEVLNGFLFIKSMMSVENVERQAIALRKLVNADYFLPQGVVVKKEVDSLIIESNNYFNENKDDKFFNYRVFSNVKIERSKK